MEEPFPSPSQDKPRTRVLREKINETEPEGIGVGTSFEIALSPAEIVRATENLEFGQHILEAFEAFLEKSETIQKEDVLRLAEAAEQGMTDAQKTVFTKVVQRILEAYQKTDKTYIRDGVETIKRFFVLQILEGQRHKNHKTSLYDKGGRIIGVLDSIVASNPSKMPHITTTPFGSFIVYVDNSDDWQLMTGVALNPIVGFKADVRPPALQEILIEKGFVPEQLDKINRTIFLANSPENQADIQEVKKHELFHDFYNIAIRPETKTVYTHRFEKETFLQVKDEIIAYLAGNRHWNPDLKSLAAQAITHAHLEDPAHAQLSPWNLLARLAQKERAEEGEGSKGKERATIFHQALRATLRELARLNLLNSPERKAALPAILGAQSFKEIAFHLSRIESNRSIDIVQISKSPDKRQLQLAQLLNNLQIALMYDLPVTGLEQIENPLKTALKNLEEQNRASNANPIIGYHYRMVQDVVDLITRVRRTACPMTEAA